MQTVKLRLYQNMVNYRREMSYGYVQTYPLPTPSMVKGMCHSILELTEYKNLKISIQGNYDTVITNMQKVKKFDRVRKERKNPLLINAVVGGNKHLIEGVMFVDLIVNMNLILHIKFDDDDLNKRLYEEFQKQIIVLGRNEDIARVDDIRMVNVEEKEINEDDYPDGFLLKYNIYINTLLKKQMQRVQGTNYRLPFYYENVKSYQDKRIFRFIDVVYISKNNVNIEEDTSIGLDEENDIVCFLGIDYGK